MRYPNPPIELIEIKIAKIVYLFNPTLSSDTMKPFKAARCYERNNLFRASFLSKFSLLSDDILSIPNYNIR